MLIIDSDNYFASGIETMKFPGGEPHVKVPRYPGGVPIHHVVHARNWDTVGYAALVHDILKHEQDYRLFMPYFPAARQDHGSPRTLEIVMRMFFEHTGEPVHVFDPHSAVLTKIHANTKVWMPSDLADYKPKTNVVGIIAPDAGAVTRAENFRQAFYPKAYFIECSKERNPSTGELSNYQLPQIPAVNGRFLVVDDICDGGGTFNLLAEAWSKKANFNTQPLELFVSHGIFSKGIPNISEWYRSITTTDSFCQAAHPRLTVLPLAPLFKYRSTTRCQISSY